MSRGGKYYLNKRSVCDCGKLATIKANSTWVCETCYAIEQRMHRRHASEMRRAEEAAKQNGVEDYKDKRYYFGPVDVHQISSGRHHQLF